MTAIAAEMNWESALATLLERLSACQRELLSLLATKRDLIIQRDHQALAELAAREQELGAELRACQASRQELLARANADGFPGKSLADLTAALPRAASARHPTAPAPTAAPAATPSPSQVVPD